MKLSETARDEIHTKHKKPVKRLRVFIPTRNHTWAIDIATMNYDIKMNILVFYFTFSVGAFYLFRYTYKDSFFHEYSNAFLGLLGALQLVEQIP